MVVRHTRRIAGDHSRDEGSGETREEQEGEQELRSPTGPTLDAILWLVCPWWLSLALGFPAEPDIRAQPVNVNATLIHAQRDS